MFLNFTRKNSKSCDHYAKLITSEKSKMEIILRNNGIMTKIHEFSILLRE
jgi:hypothetical protein